MHDVSIYDLQSTYDNFDVGLVLRQFQTKTLGQGSQRVLAASVCRRDGSVGSERQILHTADVVDINDAAIVDS